MMKYIAKLDERVIKPTLKGMEEEGMPFTGVLFHRCNGSKG